jgi:hypothetical protein
MFKNKNNGEADRVIDISSIIDAKDWHYYFFHTSPRIAVTEGAHYRGLV